MELYRAIVKLEQGGTADGSLKVHSNTVDLWRNM